MNTITYAGKHLLTFSVTAHAHTSWEFIYCTGGRGELFFEGGSLPYQSGELLVIPPHFPHRNESDSGFTNIHINMRDPELSLRTPVLIRDGENHFLLDAFRGAFFQFGANPGRQTSLLSAYGYLIVTLVNDQLSAPARSPIVEEIENCIIGSYPDENFELDSYLQSLPFNYDYLRKLFQKEVGTTPHRFLSDTRLQAAAERLSFTDTESVSISEIAHFCGFREPLYFSRMFRKKYGLSPRAYQEALRGEANPKPDERIRIEIAPSK